MIQNTEDTQTLQYFGAYTQMLSFIQHINDLSLELIGLQYSFKFIIFCCIGAKEISV